MSNNFIDRSGQRFGMLTILKRVEDYVSPQGRHHVQYECECDCGNHKVYTVDALRRGKAKSCGKHREDLVGQQFGDLTVIKRVDDFISQPSGKHRKQYLCRCACGNELVIRSDALKHQQSCGKGDCNGRLADMVGKTFGMLHVIERCDSRKTPSGQSKTRYVCQCECGNYTIVDGPLLRNGNTKSCGCLLSEQESIVRNLLQKHNIDFISEYKFDDLLSPNGYPLRFDFCILQNQKPHMLIEVNGAQHYIEQKHSTFGKLQREVTDKLKSEYCKTHNIPLYYIRYDDDTESKLYEILNIEHANPVPSMQ